MLYGQYGDGDGERNQEEDCGQQPEENRTRTGVSGGCDPARADDAGYGEECEITQPEFALQMRSGQRINSVMRSASFGTTTGPLPKFGWIGQSPGPMSWPV
jgi:hypothetical protein